MNCRLLCLGALLLAGAGCGGAEPSAPVAPSTTAPSTTEPSTTEPATTAPALTLPDLGYNAREGRALFRHYCVTCHGAEGRGDGFNAYNLDPKPRNLADPAFQAQRSDDDLAAVVRSGGGVAGLSTAMPPWGRTLSERKIRNIVDFVRTLKGDSD